MEPSDPGMPEDMWKKVRSQAAQVLGASFWEDMGKLLPKRPEPPCDMFRWNGELVVVAELAGLSSPEDIKISVTGRQLHIRGNRERPYSFTNDAIVLAECAYGPFHRVLELPEDVELGVMNAQYRQGQLLIRMRLAAARPERQVPVDFKRNEG